MQPQNNPVQFRIRTNHHIRVPNVRVIDAEGNSVGVMATFEALKLAKEQSLDLVEINPKSNPPVCKIIDFGKYKYEEKKKQNEARKNQKFSELKELSFRPNTDEGDLVVKRDHAKAFLEEGNRVKFTVRFRGREVTHPQVASDKLIWILNELGTLVGSHSGIIHEGKTMILSIFPKTNQ